MVTGDLVNTASRIQAAAAPGTVLVGDSTQRATEAAIAYAAAGEHELKGKAEPVQLWQALRVIANRGGEGALGRRSSRRSSGATASFGSSRSSSTRPRTTAARRLALGRRHRGIGKSRLALGVREVHRRAPRQPSTGTAAAVSRTARASPTGRSRTWCGCARGIAEDEPAETAIPKLSDAIAEVDRGSRRSGPSSSRASSTCSASTERVARDREDLFSAWRLFVERMAEQVPGRSSCSRTSTGRTRRCSSSSRRSSSGRARTRSSC